MVAAQLVMVGVMTMTPLHMRAHGHGLSVIGLVISVHIAGMYAQLPGGGLGRRPARPGPDDLPGRGPAARVRRGGRGGAPHDSVRLGVGLLSCSDSAGPAGWSPAPRCSPSRSRRPPGRRCRARPTWPCTRPARRVGQLAGVVVAPASYGRLTVGAAGPVGPLVTGAARPGVPAGFEHSFDLGFPRVASSTASVSAVAGRRWRVVASLHGVDIRTEGRSARPRLRPHDYRRGISMAAADREKALDAALAQIEKQFGKGSVMRLGDEGRAADRGHPDRVDRARRRARHRRAAARPGRRDLRPGVLGQDHRRAARGGQRAGGRRHRGVHRRRARARPRVRQEARRRHRRAAGLPARHR